jgi:nitrilase
MRATDIPADFPGRDDLYGDRDDWLSRGNTMIVDPKGEVLAGPVGETETILYAEIEPEVARTARRHFDVVGHYARPDVFTFEVRPGQSNTPR